jgi:hypothetical protein
LSRGRGSRTQQRTEGATAQRSRHDAADVRPVAVHDEGPPAEQTNERLRRVVDVGDREASSTDRERRGGEDRQPEGDRTDFPGPPESCPRLRRVDEVHCVAPPPLRSLQGARDPGDVVDVHNCETGAHAAEYMGGNAWRRMTAMALAR